MERVRDFRVAGDPSVHVSYLAYLHALLLLPGSLLPRNSPQKYGWKY